MEEEPGWFCINMEERKYKFSVVIPVYNVEDYLEEAVDSVINQTLGFKDNIQIIFVNDGSSDKSEDICLKYKNTYPSNVIYVKQENEGVSAARNNGIKYAAGKYVNFLDSDDKWEYDSFGKIYDFFEENYDEIDLVAARMQFFEAAEGFHMLDYKCDKGTRVISVEEEYDCAHIHITSSVLKTEIAKKMVFDTRLKYGEDTKYVTQVILGKLHYGVVVDAMHYYRRRASMNSAVQTKDLDIKYYFETPEYYYGDLIKESKAKYGTVIKYLQFVIMNDLQFRIKKPVPCGVLSGEELNAYDETIKKYIALIDDEIIIKHANSIRRELKYLALCIKYGYDIESDFVVEGNNIFFNGIEMSSVRNRGFLTITSFDIKNGKLYLSGLVNTFLKNFEVYFKVKEGPKYEIVLEDVRSHPINCYKGTFMYKRCFNTVIDLKEDITKIKIMLNYRENFYRLNVNFGRREGLCNRISNSYCVKNGKLLYKKEKELHIIDATNKAVRYYEYEYVKSMQEYAARLNSSEQHKIKKLCKFRKKVIRQKKHIKKKIWLVSDRINRANDNGEHFFKYMQTFKHPDIDVYFVIDKSSEDYERMKKIGNVIPYGSEKHKLLFCLSSKVISSQINDYVINVFDEDVEWVKNLYQFDIVFLQHGITQGDISEWLNKYRKNIKLFVTAGKPEQKSLLSKDYGYTYNEVKITGFPRYDHLTEMSEITEPEKEIIIIPTWRQYITGCTDNKTGESIYNPKFKDTDYYKFYNSLINDEMLLKCMRDKGYKGKFCLHPSFTKQYADFVGNDCITVNEGFVDYQKEFVRNKLLITDYSSVFFDFAYLKKPVIYTQFDKKSFYSGTHISKEGYYSFENDGFGPVCYDYETTVKSIIEVIENDCNISDVYKERIEKFYGHFDTDNCKRVYDCIMDIDEKKE